MKSLITIIISICFATQLASQSNDTITILHNFSEEKGMQLKWLPTSMDIFIDGFENGYSLFRAEVSKDASGNEVLSEYQIVSSQTVKPWSEAKLQQETVDDSTLSAASIFILGMDKYVAQRTASNPKEAIEVKDADEMINLLASIVVLSSNSCAEALGMYFEDKSIERGKKYIYKIETKNRSFVGYHLVYEVKETEGEKVMGLTAELMPDAISLNWYNNNNRNYPYYNVYRATSKNGKYKRLNSAPYLGTGGDIDAKFSTLVDSIPEFNKEYYYKVSGVSPFGNEGPFSDIEKINARYLMRYAPVIMRDSSNDVGFVSFDWDINKKEASHIKGFNIFRSISGPGPYSKVNSKLLSSKTRSFVDDSEKFSANYYVVTSYGESGDSLNSVFRAVMLLDSIPPAKPVGLIGKCDTNGVVSLSWEMNEELDLKGYRIFKTYDLNLDPDRVIPKDTLVNNFIDSVDLKMPYNFVYYRIYALDNHFNPSLPSDFVKIPLPDKNPPSSGYFIDYSVGMKGVSLKWTNSGAYDLANVYLYRKGDTDFDYNLVRSYQVDTNLTTSYLDTTTVSFTNYEYVLQAQDFSGLKSSYSEPIKVKQLDKRKVPSVSNLRGSASKQNRMIKLSWDFEGLASSFKLMRGRNGKPMQTYKYLDGKKREFYDKGLKPRSKYQYIIIAELKGGYKGGYSNKIEIKY